MTDFYNDSDYYFNCFCINSFGDSDIFDFYSGRDLHGSFPLFRGSLLLPLLLLLLQRFLSQVDGETGGGERDGGGGRRQGPRLGPLLGPQQWLG